MYKCNEMENKSTTTTTVVHTTKPLINQLGITGTINYMSTPKLLTQDSNPGPSDQDTFLGILRCPLKTGFTVITDNTCTSKICQ